jgi:membrane associated rhomboid family serine protease
MFIPLRVDIPKRKRPLVTEALVIINLVVYLSGLLAESMNLFDRESLMDFGNLGRGDFHIWQLITYQFLHDPYGFAHIAFNLLFLWVFGAAVEQRMGRPSFIAFYLLGGIVAGTAHMMISPHPVIGASGSISAVTGAFIVLFPRSRVQVVMFFPLIGVFAIPAMWFIGIYFALDVLQQFTSILGAGSDVAYMAHIAGSLYGFGTAFLLLALRVLPRGEFDLFRLYQLARRRREFRSVSKRQTGGLYESASSDTSRHLVRQAKKATARPASPPPADPLTPKRTAIMALIRDRDLAGAAAAYRNVLDETPEFTLPEDAQLDVANQLYADGAYPQAALAYELFAHRYARSGHIAHVRLLLALVIIRHLHDESRGREILQQIRTTALSDQERALHAKLLEDVSS